MLKHTAIQARQSAKKTKKEEMINMYGSVSYLTSVAWLLILIASKTDELASSG